MMKIKEYLELEAENDRFSHAYLFIGKNKDQQIENKINLLIQLKHCLPEDVSRLSPLDEEGKKSNIKIDLVIMALQFFAKVRNAIYSTK